MTSDFTGVSKTALLLALGMMVSSPSYANPEDGVVASGSADISAQGTKLNITQNSNKVVIDWRSFDIAPDEHTQFYQPNSNSVALNRINSANPSQILGKLTANGNIILVNPSGIAFGKDSKVDVNGLVATTSTISTSDFATGKMDFVSGGNAGATIINEGTITAKEAGLVGLVAPNVKNNGVIQAKLGKVQMASATQFSVDLYGDGLINLAVDDSVTHQVIENKGRVLAEGGTIQLTAASGTKIVNSLVNVEGELTTASVTSKGGKVIISNEGAISNTGLIDSSGTDGGEISVSGNKIVQQGKLKASGKTGAGGNIAVSFRTAYLDNEKSSVDASGNNGKGGNIAVKGKTGSRAFISGTYNTESLNDKGGQVDITSENGDLKLFGAHVNADGKLGGGQINIGGEYQGGGSLAHTKTTSVNFATTLSANATQTGDGGSVVVWSDDTTLFGGKAYALGGAVSGNGGLVEISSKDTMKIAGNAVTKASAVNGAAGSVLFDPKNITVATGGLSGGGISSFELVDPNADSGTFGSYVLALDNNNVIVTDFYDDLMATDAGAIYLFNGETGALISSLNGGSANDRIGINNFGDLSALQLDSGNLLIFNTYWDNGSEVDAGAVTWFDKNLGASGILSAANSIVGSHSGDFVDVDYDFLTADPNNTLTGNLVIRTPNWDNGTDVDAGAITWMNGSTGRVGAISSSTSLVGSTANDQIGKFRITQLRDGNFVVNNYLWDNGGISNAGASTWVNGSTGINGVISSANSMVGMQTDDFISASVTSLANGKYVLTLPYWNNGGLVDAGASTLINSSTGLTGVINSSNSLLGQRAGNRIGNYGVTALTNGNYVINSVFWGDGVTGYLGAVTWVDGNVGMAGGIISAANSLVGTHNLDTVGAYNGIVALANGNYIVSSERWGGGGPSERGAVTWGNGTTGTSGYVSAANSIIGSSAGDRVSLIEVLSNGNYLVGSYRWDNGAIANAGAVRLALADGSTVGAIDSTNSLVGGTDHDEIGGDVRVLSNGNYIVVSSYWDNGAAENAGAVVWGDKNIGVTGLISSANALVGSSSFDSIGDEIIAFSNGNYLVKSPDWDNGSAVDAGAVTWGNGATGVTGVISATNSLVGSQDYDQVGIDLALLENNNYIVNSRFWDNGAAVNAGAVTWGSSASGVSGVVSSSNSLVGTHNDDFVGESVLTLTNGNYLVKSAHWTNGTAANAGALTWGSGTAGVSGIVSAANSLVGSKADDGIGNNVVVMNNGNYISISSVWDNGAVVDAGAVTWGNAATGVTGVVSSANSLVGSQDNDQVGSYVLAEYSDNYVVGSQYWDNGGISNVGAVTWGSGTAGVTGVVSSSNSIIGSSADDQISSDGISFISSDDYIINSSLYDNGGLGNAGAITIGNSGTTGSINSSNSLFGTVSNTTGISVVGYTNDRVLVKFGYATNNKILSISGNTGSLSSYDSYADSVSGSVTLDPTFITNILNAGSNVTLQASNDITITNAIIANNGSGNGGTFTLQAGRSILINDDITTDNGNLNIFANENLATGVVNGQRDAGAAVITMASGATLDAGTGNVLLRINTGAGKTNATSGDMTLSTINGNTITALNEGASGDVILNHGSLNAASAGDSIILSSRRNFINNIGAGALNAGAGRWLVYSTSPTANTLGGLVSGFTNYTCTYGGACGALGSGNGFLYSSAASGGGGGGTPAPVASNVPATVLYVSQVPAAQLVTNLASAPLVSGLGLGVPASGTVVSTQLAPSAAVGGASSTIVMEEGLASAPDGEFILETKIANDLNQLFNGWISIDPELVKELSLLYRKI